MENTLRQRIASILSFNKITINSLSKKIGASQVTLNKQINGTTAISAKILLILLDYFKDISAEWLLRGEGDMIKKESPPEVEELLRYIKQLEALNLSGEALLQDKYEVIERLEKEIRNLKANISLLEDKLSVKAAG